MKLENYRSGEFIRMEGYKAFILSKINYNWSLEDPEVLKLIETASRELRGTKRLFYPYAKFWYIYKNAC